MSAVLRSQLRPPSLKLIAVVMADALNAKTGQLNIGIRSIADAVGIDRRQAQRGVRSLIEMGILSVVANALGGRPGATPHYLLHLDRLDGLARRTGVADDTPTGDTGDAPVDKDTGGADDADGRSTCRRGAVLMTQTGDTSTALTVLNRKEPELNRDLAQAALDGVDTLPAEAGAPQSKKSAMGKKRDSDTKTASVWKAYADAYCKRYGTNPVRNATVNGQMARLVDRLGVDEAPKVAEFYVWHGGAFYAKKMHAVGPLLADAEELRTQWATGLRAPEGSPAEQARLAHVAAFAGPFAAKRPGDRPKDIFEGFEL
ncbi:MAG: hypothetical protein H6933_04835 [Burkholderiaceae bacterium]|nr:hypothetical protein [Burkholderiaceae bacterium]